MAIRYFYRKFDNRNNIVERQQVTTDTELKAKNIITQLEFDGFKLHYKIPLKQRIKLYWSYSNCIKETEIIINGDCNSAIDDYIKRIMSACNNPVPPSYIYETCEIIES
jgi:hypothetical protein